MGSVFDPDEALVREVAKRILERPEYASWRSQTSPEWLIRWLASLYFENRPLFWAITVTLVVLFVLILWHITYTIRRGLAARPHPGTGALPASAPSFVDDAADLAERGRYLDAARAVQLAVIELLVRAERIRLGRGDANRVLREQLRNARIGDGLREELVESIRTLERHWFRDREEDEDLYRRWRQVYGRLAADVGAAA
jgi:HEPN domain-containing protein